MKAILGGIAGAVLFSVAANAAIITNGSFETGDFTGWTVTGSGTSPGNGPQVVVTNGSADSTGYGDVVPSYDGTHAAYFVDDNANESISQTFTLAGGMRYQLSFALFQTASGANNPFSFTLTDDINGVVLNTNTSSNVPVGVWTPETAAFFTTGTGSFTLTYNFNAGPEPAKDLLLDAVSITSMSAVPLPASAPMFGAALVALGAVGFGLKRKAKAAV